MGGEREFGLSVCLRRLWDSPAEAKRAADSLRRSSELALGCWGWTAEEPEMPASWVSWSPPHHSQG